ncbi:LuxR C-terminal-related transcriptional regulator [Salinimicrobium soli]|uniref:LuxR C-terminal-related transcriptional regulator n=1 Tax=Salinimicrobium soli TaxID=1254399 RepID=UPI003AAE8E57
MKMKEVRNTSLDHWSKENLINNFDPFSVALDLMNQVGSMFAVGPFYFYLVDIKDINLLYVSEGTRNVLGIPPSTFSLELLDDILHPDDVPIREKLIEFYSDTKKGFEISSYKVSYVLRLKNSEGQYRTILNQSKILGDTLDYDQSKIINIHTDISYLKASQDYQISFTCKEKPSYYLDIKKKKLQLGNRATDKLSERELDIIKHTAQGKRAEEIADHFFISVHTVNTHKRNIMKKYNCKNMSQLIADFLRKGLI